MLSPRHLTPSSVNAHECSLAAAKTVGFCSGGTFVLLVDSISFHYEQHAALVLGTDLVLEPSTGSVTFVLFFGSSLAANIVENLLWPAKKFLPAKIGRKCREEKHDNSCRTFRQTRILEGDIKGYNH